MCGGEKRREEMVAPHYLVCIIFIKSCTVPFLSGGE